MRQPQSLPALLAYAQGAFDLAWTDGVPWRIEMWDRMVQHYRQRIAEGETVEWIA